jgi:hypothetical protein
MALSENAESALPRYLDCAHVLVGQASCGGAPSLLNVDVDVHNMTSEHARSAELVKLGFFVA